MFRWGHLSALRRGCESTHPASLALALVAPASNRDPFAKSHPIILNKSYYLNSQQTNPVPRRWKGSKVDELAEDYFPLLKKTTSISGFWGDRKNQRLFLDRLAQKLNISNPDGWYRVTNATFIENHGSRLLNLNGSLYRTLSSAYPEHLFHRWLFAPPPESFFAIRENAVYYLQWLTEKLELSSFNDLSASDLIRNGGSSFLSSNGGSLKRALESVSFPRVDRVFSDARDMFLKAGVDPENPSLRSSVSLSQLLRIGGQPILSQFDYSVPKLLATIFQFSLNRSTLLSEPMPRLSDVWRDPEIVRAILEHLGYTLGFPQGNLTAWYKVRVIDILDLSQIAFANDFISFLERGFPEHNWVRSSFIYLPRFLPPRETVFKSREALLKLAEKLGLYSKASLYNPTGPLIFSAWYGVLPREYGRLLIEFDSSRHKLLDAAFSEHTWLPQLFKGHTKNFLSDSTPESISDLKIYIESQLGITKPEEWYQISKLHFPLAGLPTFFSSQQSLIQFLHVSYPNIKWEVEKMAWSSFGWSHLRSSLVQLFPNGVLTANEHFPTIKLESILRHSRILIVPQCNLLFEYQGPIAFARSILEGKPELVLTPSKRLSRLAASIGLTLISIPMWWNRSMDSLVAKLWEQRKDLFVEGGPLFSYADVASKTSPIPSSIPSSKVKLRHYVLQMLSRDPRFRHVKVRKAKRKLEE